MKLGDIVFTPKGTGIIVKIEDGLASVRIASSSIFEFKLAEIGMFYDDLK
jgi:hypothetical protein